MPEFNEWCNCRYVHGWHPWVGGECTTPGPVERGSVVPVTPVLSAALDEIYRLRTHLAVEAQTLRSIAALKNTAKGRRVSLLKSAELMERAARGEVVWDPTLSGSTAVRRLRESAGMSHTMTRAEWERETFPRGFGPAATVHKV